MSNFIDRKRIKTIEYVRVLDIMALIGRKDCEIFYITHKGNYKELVQMACDRNIVITSISKREYENMAYKIKFAEDVTSGKDILDILGMKPPTDVLRKDVE